MRAIITDDLAAFTASMQELTVLSPSSTTAWVANSIEEGRRGHPNADPLALDIPQPTTLLHLAARHNAVACLTHLLTTHHTPATLTDSQRATALDDCALYGSLPAARLLVQAGCDPRHVSNRGASILHTAAAEGQVMMVRWCCGELGLELNRPCNEGWTPLVWALDAKGGGRLATLAVLIDAGADVNCRDRGGATPLMWAISSLEEPSDDVVKLLVRSRADLDAVDREGVNAFERERWDPKGLMVGPDGWVEYREMERVMMAQTAAPGGSKRGKRKKGGGGGGAAGKRKRQRSPVNSQDVVEERMEAEVAMDCERKEGPSDAFPVATDCGANDLPVPALAEGAAGAEGPVGEDAKGVKANGDSTHVDAERALPPLPSPLPFLPPTPPLTKLDRAESRIPLCWRHETRAGRGRRYLFQELLNRAVEEGDYGNVERVRSLLSDWHAAHARHRMFPLEYDSSYPVGPMQVAVAFENDDTAILALLLQARIDPLKKTAAGWLPIHAAANVGNPRCVRMLLEEGGVDANMAEERDGYTALMMAADDVNGGEVARVLLEREGIDVNRSDHHGNTALHWAVFKGNLGIAQQLVGRRGIQLHATNKWGNTAMHYAMYRGVPHHTTPHHSRVQLNRPASLC